MKCSSGLSQKQAMGFFTNVLTGGIDYVAIVLKGREGVYSLPRTSNGPDKYQPCL